MIFNNDLYEKEIREYTIENKELLNKLNYKKVLLTGAAGLIVSYLIDILMYYNLKMNGNIFIYALDKDKKLSNKRFKRYKSNNKFCLMNKDIIKFKRCNIIFNYAIHAASNTSPIDYITNPVMTTNTNIIGNYNLLEYFKKNNIERYLYCSSVEVYGENRDNEEKFDELYSGYVDCNKVRSCYPTSKRSCESMCSSYASQYGIDYVIARIGRVFGPTIIKSDCKALSHFLINGVQENDIVMKSDGLQQFSYCYVGDTAIALLMILIHGEKNNAYNVATKDSIVKLKDFAQEIAKITNRKVIFEKDNELITSGYSQVTRAVLNTNKLYQLGFKPMYTISKAIQSTIEIMKNGEL